MKIYTGYDNQFLLRTPEGKWERHKENHNDFDSRLETLDRWPASIAELVHQYYQKKLQEILKGD